MKIKAKRKEFKKSSNVTYTQCTQVVKSTSPTALCHGYFVVSLPEVSLNGIAQKSVYFSSWQFPFRIQQQIQPLKMREKEKCVCVCVGN